MIREDHWTTANELRLAAIEEERQRAAQKEAGPICTCLGSLITGIFGPKPVNEQSRGMGTEAATQTERKE
jgi:hypothetical protein